MLLQARDLVVVLPGDSGDIRVLDGVSLELEAGSVTDVVGPSGSGKTTLLRALARLLPDMSGSLALDGLSAETDPRPRMAGRRRAAAAEAGDRGGHRARQPAAAVVAQGPPRSCRAR